MANIPQNGRYCWPVFYQGQLSPREVEIKNNPQEACIQVAAVFLPVMSKILKKHAMRKMQVKNGL